MPTRVSVPNDEDRRKEARMIKILIESVDMP
jgi:hypothetical protein